LKFGLVFILAFSVLALSIVPAPASEGNPYPPPAGKAWVRSGGKWVMVPAPPNEGPYRWTGNDWARIENIPPGRKWVSPRWDWDNNKWVMGRWRAMRSEDETQVWISGHWEKNGHWTEGHWETGERRSTGIDNDTWIPGINSPRPIRPRPPGLRPPVKPRPR